MKRVVREVEMRFACEADQDENGTRIVRCSQRGEGIQLVTRLFLVQETVG